LRNIPNYKGRKAQKSARNPRSIVLILAQNQMTEEYLGLSVFIRGSSVMRIFKNQQTLSAKLSWRDGLIAEREKSTRMRG
jgi:hypothetical protein